ncbi:F-box family protein [Dorcoceras hygrometricum]|uniref:F-box family protein n=1 Tax=Dorcoceras hygrometricum TaxID=472368 RepID=A0A2Z7DD20_9LAMI|nr:F-box family protein [Dorcoceras hygrometricum]
MISSGLLVQPDEGVSDLVVDRIGDNLPQSTEKSRIIVIPVGARHKCQRVTLAMSLFDLQDKIYVIGSLATLDSPMAVDLIGIYVLKGKDSAIFPLPLLSAAHHHTRHRRRPRAAARCCSRDWTCSDHVDEEIPFVTNSSALLVQTDEGAVNPVVDRIRRSTAAYC